MKTITLPTQTREATGATHKAIITAADVLALGAAATGNLNILQKSGTGVNVPAGSVVDVKSIHLVTAFTSSDGSATGLTFTVGDSGSATRLLSSTQILTGATPITDKVGAGPTAYTSATAVNAYFTAAGGSALLSLVTAGTLEIYFQIKPNDLTKAQ